MCDKLRSNRDAKISGIGCGWGRWSMASWLVTHRGSPPVENRYGIEVNNGNGDGNESHEFPEMFRPRISHTCFSSVARIELRLHFSQGKPSTCMNLAEACGTAASRISEEPRGTTVPQMYPGHPRTGLSSLYTMETSIWLWRTLPWKIPKHK